MQSDEDMMLLPFNAYEESSNSKLENSTLDESRMSICAQSDVPSASDTDQQNTTMNTSNETQVTDESTNTLVSGNMAISNLIRRSRASKSKRRKSDDLSDRIRRRACRSRRRRSRSSVHSRMSWSPIDPNSAHSRGNGRRTSPVWRRDEETYIHRCPARRSSSPSTRRHLSPWRYNTYSKSFNSPEKSERYRCRSPLSTDREEEDTDNRRDRGRPRRRSADDKGDLRDTIRNKRGRKDFEERGLCFRGDSCPFDHGQNPVVLQDVHRGSGLKITGEPNIDDLRLLRSARLKLDAHIQQHNTSIPAPPVGRKRLPLFSGPFGKGSPRVLPHPHWSPVPPRQLTNVPIMGPSRRQMLNTTGNFLRGPPPMGAYYRGQSRRGSYGNGWARGRGAGRGRFDRSRLGANPKWYMNCSLVVKRIPSSQNTITELNTHFNRFGKIMNIQINFENDRGAALITFSSPNEAVAAYKSTEAVLKNRFIRVFWHKHKENEFEQRLVTIKPNQEGNEDGDVLAVSVTVYNDHKVDDTKKMEKAQALEAIKKSQEQLAAQQQLKKSQIGKKQETLKFINDLKKKKQIIFAEQIEQQKKMIHKWETNKSMKPEEKDHLKGLIKNLQNSIEKLNDGL